MKWAIGLFCKRGILRKHAPGSELYANITLQNLGYAPPFNPRKVELILRSKDGKTTYVASLPDDPRKWQPYKSATINAKSHYRQIWQSVITNCIYIFRIRRTAYMTARNTQSD